MVRLLRKEPDKLQGDWLGATVVVLGSGPSLTPEQVNYCKGKAKVIAINNTVTLAPWADLLYFCDKRWYEWHQDWVSSFKGQIMTLENYELREKIPGLKCLEKASLLGLSCVPTSICTGSNSGVQVLNICLHLRAAKIILLGMDAKSDGKKTHWFGEHPIPTPVDIYEKFVEGFGQISNGLEACGVEVVNATTRTALDCFPKVSLSEVL